MQSLGWQFILFYSPPSLPFYSRTNPLNLAAHCQWVEVSLLNIKVIIADAGEKGPAKYVVEPITPHQS